MNEVEERIMILLIFTNPEGKGFVDLAIEYSNDNRMRILRDDRVIE